MLAEYLAPQKIILDLKENNYRETLKKMVGLSNEMDVDQVLDGIYGREKIMPTALGKGIFLPRVVIDEKSRSEVIVAINHSGVVFEDYGTSVASIIMLFLFSKHDDRAAILAQGLRLLNDDSLRATLLDCRKPEDVIRAITDWEKQ